MHELADAFKLPPFAIEYERTERHLLDQWLLRRPAPFQDAVDAQQQFAGIERLGEVVVRAGFEPGNAAFGLRPRGQHQDGHVECAPKADDERNAVLAGHHNVDDQEVERKAVEVAPGFCRVAGVCDAKTVFPEIAGQ